MADGNVPAGPVSLRETVVYWLKILGILAVICVASAIVLGGVLGFDRRQTIGFSAILAVLGSVVSRALVGPSPAARRQEELRKQHPPAQTSSGREVVETIVFVVVLVLLLKSFVAEAFVIPTGSMATTLLGYHEDVTCPQCGYRFPVNCSKQVEDKAQPIIGCTCPNCRYPIDFGHDGLQPACDAGDRVLVAKFLYDTHLRDIRPFDVVVFKFPEGPQKDFVPMNYIKRLIGLPGQTIGVYYGNIYVAEGLVPDQKQKDDEAEQKNGNGNEPAVPPLRRRTYKNEMTVKGVNVKDWLEKGDPRFKILRKPPDKVLALQRIVYDNDHQPEDRKSLPPRWLPDKETSKWNRKPAGDKQKEAHRTAGAGPEIDWLRYHHVVRGSSKPELITDFVGYNHGSEPDGRNQTGPPNWVGDLILECTVAVEQAEGEFVLELSEGVDRFQARWQFPSGVCTLVRLQDGKPPEKLAEKETSLKKPGGYHVRFANVDERLTVWVDNSLPFGDGVAYEPPVGPDGGMLRGPTEKNDLEPASVGVKGGACTVQELRLWRDTYYTIPDEGSHVSSWNDPSEWKNLRNLPGLTMYVEPGHYLCMGDNSPASSDSRSWGPRSDPHDQRGGLVPKELMLGRALLVYWPFGRFGPIK